MLRPSATYRKRLAKEQGVEETASDVYFELKSWLPFLIIYY